MIEQTAETDACGSLYGDERGVEEPTEQFCSFRLGGEWYGIPIARVREVVRVGFLLLKATSLLPGEETERITAGGGSPPAPTNP